MPLRLTVPSIASGVRQQQPVRAYGVAAGIGAAGVFIFWLSGDPAPLLASVALTFFQGGKGPGLLSTGICGIAAGIFFLTGDHAAITPGNYIHLALFGATAILLGGLIQNLQRRGAQAHTGASARQTVEGIPGMAWTADAQGGVTGMNASFREYAAVSDIASFSHRKAIHPEDFEHSMEQWLHCLATGEEFCGTYRLRGAGGSYRWFRSLASPTRDGSGQVTGWHGTLVDIDDQKLAEEALRASEAGMRAILDNVPGIIATADAQGHHNYANKRNLEYFGVNDHDFDGLGWLGIIHPEERDGVAAAWRRAVETGEPMDVIHRLRRFDGEYRSFHARVEPARDEHGKVVRWYGMISDIHDRVTAEEKLRKAEQELRTIIDTIPALVISSWPDGRVDFVNAHWAGQGFREEDLRGSKTGPIHPDDLALFQEKLNGSLATGEPYEVEVRLRKANGDYHWYLTRAVALRDETGKVVKRYATATQIDDLKAAEKRLREAGQELRTTIDTIPALVISAWPDGGVDFVNKQWARDGFNITVRADGSMDFVNAPASEPLPLDRNQRMSSAGNVHPDDLAQFEEKLDRSLKTGEPYQVEMRLRKANGDFHWYLTRGVSLRDETGKVIKRFATATDIHDRKLAEQKLRDAERELRTTIDTIPALVVSSTPDGRVDFVNAHWMEQGFREADLREGLATLIHPDDLAQFEEKLDRSLKTGEPYQIEMRLRKDNGDYHWYLTRAVTLRDETGAVVKRYATATDVDDRKKAEEALRVRERELQLLVDTIPALVWCLTPDGQPEYINKRLETYFGHTVDRSEVDASARLARPLRALIHPDDLEAVHASMNDALEAGEAFTLRYRNRRADGVYRWVDVRAEPLRDDGGHIVKWYGVTTDIEDEMKTQEALRIARDKLARASHLASVAEMSASIAHEISQPLAAVVANGHACNRWLSANPPNMQRARRTSERIVRDAMAASDVISRIRALFTRTASAREAIDLNMVIDEVGQLMTAELVAKGIFIETDLDVALPPALADRIQVQQVLVNLIRNGMDAMKSDTGAPKSLVIASRRDGDGMILVKVRDNGDGISEPDRIFEPFFTTKDGSMGMGLAICRSILEAHDGRLWAESIHPRGTAFSFTLPVHLREMA